MKLHPDKIAKIDVNFDEMMRKISRQRIILGKDKTLKSIRRLTLAMVRHPDMGKIARDIAEADLSDE